MLGRRYGYALLAVITVAAITTYAVLVWPTAYRPIPLGTGAHRSVLAAREHRVSGRVELLTAKGWQPLNVPRDTIDDPFAALEAKYGITH